ncbi:MAG: 4Fe-4S dicluster domain-containing protein [Pseudomonadota bacterium]
MSKREIWQAPQDFLDKMPEISGNTVNGQGEEDWRRASPFFWHPPAKQTHGDLMKYVVTNNRPTDGEDYSYRNPKVDRGPKLVKQAERAIERSAEDWTAAIKEFVLANEGDDLGITAMTPAYVYTSYEVKEKWVIIIAVQHDYDRLAQVPVTDGNMIGYHEIHQQYNRGARVAARLTNWLREQGQAASSWPGPYADALLMIPAAIQAGLGELGKHGSMIHPKFGSGFRLAAVTTDAPLIADSPIEFGADEFCTNCQLCSHACPPDAIYDEKQWVRGEKKWYVDFDACIPYFGTQYACGICIAVCPWTRPGLADGLITKMARRRAKPS